MISFHSMLIQVVSILSCQGTHSLMPGRLLPSMPDGTLTVLQWDLLVRGFDIATQETSLPMAHLRREVIDPK